MMSSSGPDLETSAEPVEEFVDRTIKSAEIVNNTGVEVDPLDVYKAIYDSPEVAAIQQWATDLQANSGSRRLGGIFNRDRYLTPGSVYDQFQVAFDAVASDDVVSGVVETTESLAFSKMKFDLQDQDQEDIWNQIAKTVDLDSRMREMWREMFTYSQVIVAIWWGTKNFKVRGKTDTGKKKKKTFTGLEVPLGITMLDPMKVVPCGMFWFGKEKLLYMPDASESLGIDKVLAGEEEDLIIKQIITQKYEPTQSERNQLADMGISTVGGTSSFYLLNPESVWRHTDTKSGYQKFANVRLKSVFELLDIKNNLRQRDRTHLIAATNFIIVITKGTDKRPATPAEVNALKGYARSLARMPLIVGDHRLKIEIVTPSTDTTLKPEQYNTIDARLTARLYRILMTGNYCLTPDAEVMTSAGWKTYDQLQKGERVLTMDPATQRSHWQDLQAVNVFDYDGKMLSMESASHSSLSTPNHRWFTKQDGTRYMWKTSETLNTASRIPLSAPHDAPVISPFSDEFVEFVAWYVTEGYVHSRGLAWERRIVSQSETANPTLCDRIRNVCGTLFGEPGTDGKWNEWGTGANRDFAVKSEFIASLLDTVSPDKVPTPEFLTSLTSKQLDLFVETCVDADGCRSGGKNSMFSNNPDFTRAFEMAAVLSGRPIRTSTRKPVGDLDPIIATTLLKSEFTSPISNKNFDWVNYSGKVWCPTTPDSTWLVRRNGTVFWTGNSSGAKGDKSGDLTRVIGKGLESSRHQLKRALERNLFERIMEKNDILDEDPTLRFVPSKIALEFDPSYSSFMIELRAMNEISRETLLSEFDMDQDDEARWREYEKDSGMDDIFETINPNNQGIPGSDGGPDGSDQAPADTKNVGRMGGGRSNGGGAAPGKGQGQAPRNITKKAD
jgi:hypothetical protein